MTLDSGIRTDELDPAIRPQDDLFRHVNGKWIDRTEIPSDKARYGSFYVLAEEAEKAVRDIIVESQSADPGTEARKVGDLYASFMDEARAQALAAEPIKELVAEAEAIDSIDSLLTTLGRLERGGSSGFFQLFVDNDPGQPERYLVFVEQAGLGLPDESYYRDEKFADVRQKYVAFLERMLGLAGLSDPAARAARIMALETEIASHHWDNVTSRDSEKTYNPMLWQAANDLVGAVDMNIWLSALGVPEGSFDEVVVRQPSFMAGLESVLRAENLDAWRDWLAWQVIRSNAPYLSSDFVDANFDFYGRTLTGTPELRARWKRGVSLVEGALGEAVGRIYVERHFPPAAKTAMDELVANLVEAYRQSITEPRLDERRDPQARPREAGQVHPQDRLPGQVARLLHARDQRRRPHRQRAGDERVRVPARARQDRQTPRSRRVVHDTADHQRVLQPRLQRDRVPGGDPAVPVLRREPGCGGELRRDRRDHRPRDRPRLRRSGIEVRRRRPAHRLVDRRRTRPPSRIGRRRSSGSTTCSRHGRCPTPR